MTLSLIRPFILSTVADHGTGHDDEKNTMKRIAVNTAIDQVLQSKHVANASVPGLPGYHPTYDQYGAVALHPFPDVAPGM